MKIIILAAGKSKRFKSNTHKALHQILGLTILERQFKEIIQIKDLTELIYIIGHQKDQIIEHVENLAIKYNTQAHNININFVEQKEQLGTGHAVLTALESEPVNNTGYIILCADIPCISIQTLNTLLNNNQHALLTAILEENTGYGRIIKDNNNTVTQIVEETDCTTNQKAIQEINTGIYYFHDSTNNLINNLKTINNQNNQGEYYLTDLVSKYTLQAIPVMNSIEILGLNDKQQLIDLSQYLSLTKCQELIEQGVIIENASSCKIAPEVTIGKDSIIESNVQILGNTVIGENCHIGANSVIHNAVIDDNNIIRQSHIYNSEISQKCKIGPFAHLRDQAVINNQCLIGNFVEIKNTRVDQNSFVSHLSYLGDANIGKDVNIGAGTITANFNSLTLAKTQVCLGNNVKTGSNSVLIAPVNIADDSMIAAGSVITSDVADKGSLAIARSKQEIKRNWVYTQTN